MNLHAYDQWLWLWHQKMTGLLKFHVIYCTTFKEDVQNLYSRRWWKHEETKFRKNPFLKNMVFNMIANQLFFYIQKGNGLKLLLCWFELIRIRIRAYGSKFVIFDLGKSPQYTYYVFFAQDENLAIFDIRPTFLKFLKNIFWENFFIEFRNFWWKNFSKKF